MDEDALSGRAANPKQTGGYVGCQVYGNCVRGVLTAWASADWRWPVAFVVVVVVGALVGRVIDRAFARWGEPPRCRARTRRHTDDRTH